MNANAGGAAAAPSWLVIDDTSSIPPYEQIRRRIAEQARTGRLAVGTKLPSVRALAAALGLAVNTVARAYRELEQAGVVQTRSRAGTVIAAGTDSVRERLAQAAADYAAVVSALGAGEKEAVAALRAALRTRGQ